MACIIWTAGQMSTGYGQQRYEGTTHKAYSVGQDVVSRIVNNKAWKDLV